MKNFVEFQDAIQRFNIVDEVSTVAYAEWNLNRYIDGAIAVTDTLPTTTSFDDRQAELEQISKGFLELINIFQLMLYLELKVS